MELRALVGVLQKHPLFNASLDGNTRRAIDIHEGEEVDEADFKALDKDGDGELDVFFLDEDGDGNADLVGTDRDGDGEPDGYRKM